MIRPNRRSFASSGELRPGSLILIGVMMRIERRSRARDEEVRIAALAPRAEPGTVEARPGGISAATPLDPPAPAPPQRPHPVQQRPIRAATGAASLGPTVRDVPSVLHDAGPNQRRTPTCRRRPRSQPTPGCA
ncbi:MAG: hypothetical protein ACSLFN_04400 [Candidatus Limnocylindrales bacterium]